MVVGLTGDGADATMDLDSFLDGLLGARDRTSPPRSKVTRAEQAYQEAVLAIAEEAASWALHAASGARCGLRLRGRRGEMAVCAMPAISRCVVCASEVCLAHALVAPRVCICLACVEAAKRHHDAASMANGTWEPSAKHEPEPPRRPKHDFGFIYPEEEGDDPIVAERAKNLRVLECKPTATDDEVNRAYKRLALEHHPDRAPEASREWSRKRTIEINAAYAWLREHRGAA